MHVSKFNPTKNTWDPYSGIQDMQLEFTMLDPHIRTSLPLVPGKAGEYSAAFRIPDRHGVFKSVVNHKRKGWTHLESTTVVPVVLPRHDENPRCLRAAWPYYIGAMSTSAAFVLFVAFWLSGDDREGRKKGLETEWAPPQHTICFSGLHLVLLLVRVLACMWELFMIIDRNVVVFG